ncbi:MAG: hypothetical protein ABF649_08540 [Bacillus sp. (in: firmicutes)]
MSGETLPHWIWLIYYLIITITLIFCIFKLIQKKNSKFSIITIIASLLLPIISFIHTIAREEGTELDYMITALSNRELWPYSIIACSFCLLLWWIVFFQQNNKQKLIFTIPTSLVLLSLYCYPYVYMSMYKDLTNGSMAGYVWMLIIFSIAAFVGKHTNNLFSIIVGNILSILISYYFIVNWNKDMNSSGYFKPLSPEQLLLFTSILMIIPQLLFIQFSKKINKERKK